ncbi:terminase large subunit [Flexibacterium corallicola]|uniref:terminase large subunit n=1 Tax=Flexibacterium corallicola TaxID=3037259 RepID=UPI00286FA2C1|nr:terminase large subunit [Pseudovibrio sp. M1P-2-3]
MRTNPERDPVTAWAEDVDAGRIVAGPHIRASARRHLTDLEDGHKRGLIWDAKAALDTIEFFPRKLRLNGGEFEGIPFHLHPSQKFRVGSIFGWKNKETGFRRFRRFYDEEGKGNGKSPMLAGIGMVGLLKDGENRAQIYSAAAKKDQADILFQDAVAMREQSPALAKAIRASGVEPVYQLTYIGKQGDKRIFKPISSDKKKSGHRPHMALCDEVHEHPDRTTIDMLERGFKQRKQPLLAMATNAGTDRHSVCYEEHTHAKNVAHGLVEDDTTFSFVCSLDEGDDWENDPSCWIKPNPLLGTILTEEYLAIQVKQAKDILGRRNGIARLHFCEWTDSETAAFSREVWMKCVGEVDEREMIEAGYPCYGGLDLSRTKDFTAFSLTWVLDDTKDAQIFKSKTWFWTPADTLRQRAQEDGRDYDIWAEQGYIEPVKGVRISWRWLAEAIAEICGRVQPEQIGCDEYGLDNLADHLNEIGACLPIIKHPQGFQKKVIEVDKTKPEGEQEVYLWMPDSIIKFENAVLEQRTTVERNLMMNNCVGNCTYAENRTGHRMFDKEKATGRIDGMVSMAMSIGMATCRERFSQGPSVYETRGIRMV